MDLEKEIPIKTDRLLIDRFKNEDWKDFYRIERSREQHRYNFESYKPRTVNQIKEFLTNLSQQNYNELKQPVVFAIRLAQKKKLIGFIGLKKGELVKDVYIEVYYSIYKKHWNKGYGTEALKAIISFCFTKLKLHRIFAGCDFDNAASKRIMEKAGMRFESYWKKDRKRNNKWCDGIGFAIIDEDIK